MYDIDEYMITNRKYLKFIGRKAVDISGANIIKTLESPNQLIFVLSESHLSMKIIGNNLMCDFYTCGHVCDPMIGIKYIEKCLNAKFTSTKYMIRGEEYSIIVQ